MDKKLKIPKGRSIDSIIKHYEIEKSIATQLKTGDIEQRKILYRDMYDILFGEIGDHPRLLTRSCPQRTKIANKTKNSFLKKHIDNKKTVLEFAPGDCRFSTYLCNYVKYVYAVDISDQRENKLEQPENFRLIIYDGYSLGLAENSIDVIFSDHLIEHLHPEDTHLHFELSWRILVPGGKYLFRTPHLFTGPHDVSKYFSEIPEGFHLKEWTNTELEILLRDIGFRQVIFYWALRNIRIRLPMMYFRLAEKILKNFPQYWKRRFATYFLRTINVLASK